MASNSASKKVTCPAQSNPDYAYTLATSFSETSTNTASNTSTISCEASIVGTQTRWDVSSGGGTLALYWFDDYANTGGKLIASKTILKTTRGTADKVSGTITVTHKSDGNLNGYTKLVFTKNVTNNYIPASTNLSTANTPLTYIPRYAASYQSLNSKTETTITINWSSDSIIDYIWYDINASNNWIPVGPTYAYSGSYTITGLSANTPYAIRTLVRRADSQLTTPSIVLSVMTYEYPYVTNAPNFTIGNNLTLSLFNPLSRQCTIYLITADGKQYGGFVTSSTSISGFNDDALIENLYKSIPNSDNGQYKVRLVYGSIDTTIAGGKYTAPDTPPEFNNFTYKDANLEVVAITGDDSYIIKNKSELQVTIPVDDKMIAKKYANGKNYFVSCGPKNQFVDYSDIDDVTVNLGTINAVGETNLLVTAYDTRIFSKSVTKTINIIDYQDVIQKNTLSRVNNFENETNLKIAGSFSPVTIDDENKNTIKEIKYRYKEVREDGEYNDYVSIKPTIISNNYETEVVTFDLDNQKSFIFEIVVTDAFGIPSITYLLLDEGIPIQYINAVKKNVGIGCINEHENYSLEVKGNIYMASGNEVLDYEVIEEWEEEDNEEIKT